VKVSDHFWDVYAELKAELESERGYEPSMAEVVAYYEELCCA
jgi:hypothetical protein